MVTTSSSVPFGSSAVTNQAMSPHPNDPTADSSDSETEDYKSALKIMHAQRNDATLLAATRLAELENARADLAVANATLEQRSGSLNGARVEVARLLLVNKRLSTKLSTVTAVGECICAQLLERDAEVSRLRDTLTAIRDKAADELNKSD